MATQPVLGGTTLAYPSEYEANSVLAGATRELADGTLSIDIVDPDSVGTKRRVYKLAWAAITETDANTIESAYWAMVAAGSASFTSPSGASVTVQPLKDAKFERKSVKMNGGTLRYNVTMELKQIG